jgi:hypothetical protein
VAIISPIIGAAVRCMTFDSLAVNPNDDQEPARMQDHGS